MKIYFITRKGRGTHYIYERTAFFTLAILKTKTVRSYMANAELEPVLKLKFI